MDGIDCFLELRTLDEAGNADFRGADYIDVDTSLGKSTEHAYLVKLVEAALIDTDLPIALHLDHGADFDICKSCIDGGFTSVMFSVNDKS